LRCRIPNAWAVLPIELLHGVTYGAAWAGCTSFAHLIAPKGGRASFGCCVSNRPLMFLFVIGAAAAFAGLETTTQGLLGAVHWGLGNGGGALLGA
jgi:hypothetical protein